MSQEFQLLQRIAENTTPRKTSMISITSTNPEFNVNFPSPVSVKEIALAKLRVYHSWPNIRSVEFGGKRPNNSLVFAYKNKKDDTPDWNVVSIPTGSYQIEQINNELQRRIKSITRKESKIAITVHEPTLSSAIEINSPGYFVDIYNSSLRTVLGWPKKPLRSASVSIPEPKKSDYITDKIGPENPIKSYKDDILDGRSETSRSGRGIFYISQQSKLTENFAAMNNDFSILLISLRSGNLTKDEFIGVIETCNKIIDDMEKFNSQIIQDILDDDSPRSRTLFANNYKIDVKDLPTFKLPGYNVPELKKQLNTAIDEGFRIIHDEWRRKQPKPTILTHNNSQNGDGRHIAPNNVNISSVIALNLTCDVIEGSYQINLEQSNQARQ
jgi:hypothetical protein